VLLLPQSCLTSTSTIYHHHQLVSTLSCILYTDDLSAYAVGPEVHVLCDRVNTYDPILLFSSSKNGTWLFIQRNPQSLCSPLNLIKPMNILRFSFLSEKKQPEIFGVTHYTIHTFSPSLLTAVSNLPKFGRSSQGVSRVCRDILCPIEGDLPSTRLISD